jgi:hypothetical protein
MSDYMRDLRARVGTSLLEIPSVALAIRDEAGRVLLGRTVADGRWLLPGGCRRRSHRRTGSRSAVSVLSQKFADIRPPLRAAGCVPLPAA